MVQPVPFGPDAAPPILGPPALALASATPKVGRRLPSRGPPAGTMPYRDPRVERSRTQSPIGAAALPSRAPPGRRPTATTGDAIPPTEHRRRWQARLPAAKAPGAGALPKAPPPKAPPPGFEVPRGPPRQVYFAEGAQQRGRSAPPSSNPTADASLPGAQSSDEHYARPPLQPLHPAATRAGRTVTIATQSRTTPRDPTPARRSRRPSSAAPEASPAPVPRHRAGEADSLDGDADAPAPRRAWAPRAAPTGSETNPVVPRLAAAIGARAGTVVRTLTPTPAARVVRARPNSPEPPLSDIGDARQRVVDFAARSAANRHDLVEYCIAVSGELRIEGQLIYDMAPSDLPSYLLLGYSDVVVATPGLDTLD